MAFPSEYDQLYAKIALNHKLVNEKDIRNAFGQLKANPSLGLGAVMMQMGLISNNQHIAVERAAAYRNQREQDKLLARIIVEAEYTSKESVTAALEEQKQRYTKSGETAGIDLILGQSGGLTAEQVVAARKIRKIKTGGAS